MAVWWMRALPLDRVLSFLWDSMANENPYLLQKTREMGQLAFEE